MQCWQENKNHQDLKYNKCNPPRMGIYESGRILIKVIVLSIWSRYDLGEVIFFFSKRYPGLMQIISSVETLLRILVKDHH